MAIDPPWRLDPFQNIVNVRWGGKNSFLLCGSQFLMLVDAMSGGVRWLKYVTYVDETSLPVALDRVGNSGVLTEVSLSTINIDGFAASGSQTFERSTQDRSGDPAGLDAICFDGFGNLYAVNSSNSGSNGTFFGFTPNGAQFSYGPVGPPPFSCACDVTGNLFVTSTNKGVCTVQKFSGFGTDAGKQIWISSFGDNIASSGFFSSLVVDSLGNVWVFRELNDSSGIIYRLDGSTGAIMLQINLPSPGGLDVDDQDNIFVALFDDSGNGLINKYDISGSGATFVTLPPFETGFTTLSIAAGKGVVCAMWYIQTVTGERVGIFARGIDARTGATLWGDSTIIPVPLTSNFTAVARNFR